MSKRITNKKLKLPAGHCWQSVAEWKGQTIAGLVVTGFVERVVLDVRTYNGLSQQRPRRNDSAIGHCGCSPDMQRSMPVGVLAATARQGKLFPCSVCRTLKSARHQNKKKRNDSAPNKQAIGLQAKWDRLTKAQCAAVSLIIGERRKAMTKQQIREDAEFDRILTEAIDVVLVNEREPAAPPFDGKELFRRYDVYASPNE